MGAGMVAVRCWLQAVDCWLCLAGGSLPRSKATPKNAIPAGMYNEQNRISHEAKIMESKETILMGARTQTVAYSQVTLGLQSM